LGPCQVKRAKRNRKLWREPLKIGEGEWMDELVGGWMDVCHLGGRVVDG